MTNNFANKKTVRSKLKHSKVSVKTDKKSQHFKDLL